MTTIRFTTEDLDLFQSASHDRNPLHASHEYARRTAYGGRVVYGVLNALTALGKAAVLDRPEEVLSTIECDFFDVATVGVEYSVTTSVQSPSEITVRVSDGRRPVLELILTFRPGTGRSLQQTPGDPLLRSDAQDFRNSDLHAGQRVSGTYSTSQHSLEVLCTRVGLHRCWAATPEISAVLWASYLIGMELPGKRALFSRLLIEFQPHPPVGGSFQYEAEIERISDVGEVSIRAGLSSGGQTWATATMAAYVRQDVPIASPEEIEKLVGRSETLMGKVALVTGGSRGLGACMVRALALHGCNVVMNFLNSQLDAEQVLDSLAQSRSKVSLEKGDVADIPWCTELQHKIAFGHKRLDFLICNASPPLLPLWLEPSAAARVNAFLAKSLAMVTAPTAVLMPLVAESKGWNVLISSSAVTQIHPHFPHYAAAKSAAEAIARAVAAEYRTVSGLIVRPTRLLTDLTNTPLGRKGATRPESIAASVVKRLLLATCPGKVEVLEDFVSPYDS
jgi:NAD(P)-dependent dehydrogenase (short-subunit alcohol dehydrogenase family)